MGSPKLDIIVIGGSLGGLLVGLLLKRLGHSVRILERNPTPLLQNQGAGLIARGEVRTFFDRYDATKSPIAISSPRLHYLSKAGRTIYEEPSQMKMTSWDLLYNILRANFDGTKSAYCPVPPEEGDGKGIYDYGHTFKSVREVDKDHVEVIYLNKEGKEQTSTVDLLIGSDGASSTLRRMLRPDVTRSYAGYVAWRGTVLESSVSEAARNTFVEQITYFHTKGQQILAYTIPGKNGTLEVGQRLINFVWYCNYPEDSESYNELMTDSDGQKHRITLPAGKIRSEVWEKQKQFARDTLPPQFAEIVTDCQQPFIQAIGDVPPSENVFFGGKVLMIGDAFSGFRPHAAASTNQAALDSLLLGEKLEGKISLEEWKQKTFEYAAETQKHSVSIGDLSQYGEHPLDGMKVQ